MSEKKVLGPITLEAKVHCIKPGTGDTAVANYLFPGQVVDEAGIEKALRASAAAVAEHGYVLMGADTFFNHVIVKEKTGRAGNFSTPASFQYDAFGLETAEAEPEEADDDEEYEDE